MTTYPHENNENGYALRIGKHLPKHAANLAYVHTDTPEPEKNIVVNDYTLSIPENNVRIDEQDAITGYVSEDGTLHTESGVIELRRPEVLLTNEYDLVEQTPLFYVHRSRFLFDARRSMVSHPINGKQTTRAKLWEEYPAEDRTRFVLHNEKITLTQINGGRLLSNEAYKIILEKAGNEDYLYRVLVYTAFDGKEQNYALHYPAYDTGKNQKETLNPVPLFNEYQSQGNVEQRRSYQLESQANGMYRIKLPTEDNTFLVTEDTRPGHTFEYQLISSINARLSDKNPLTVNIGIIYINDTIINATRTTSALRKLVQNNPYMPEYLTFQNPHRQPGYHDKQDVMYWASELTMPRDHWLNYDVLIITGYGDKDFTNAADNIRSFLDTGGILIFDTSGGGSDVLNPIRQDGTQTFVANLSYSKTEQEQAHRTFTEEATMVDRYYDLSHPERIGRLSPVIRFHGEESSDDWDIYIRHANGGPALMRKRTGSIGQLVVSNMGWMLDVLFGKEEAIQFFSNFLLFALESRRFVSPVFKDHVFHRDDLYAEDYRQTTGETLYFDDRSDEDSSQIVAKKILHENIEQFARQYLPDAYRRHQSATYRLIINDSGEIPVSNSQFEQANPEGNAMFERTTLQAIPGFDFVRFSGDSTRGEHTTQIRRSGRRSISVQTESAQGFFEQDLGVLPEGSYELTGYVKGESTAGGGIGLYDQSGTQLAETNDLSGTFHWRQERIYFTLQQATQVFLRLGAHRENQTSHVYFDDISLHTTSVIRMTPEGPGGRPLYAYATTPKGKSNQLNRYEQQQSINEVVKVDTDVSGTLTVRSFVYQWFSADGRFRKEYGNQKNTRFTIRRSQGEVTLGSIQEFLPALQSGAEWARKDRVYYEISLEPHKHNDYVNISLYDPSVDKYYFTPDGEWVLNHEDIWWNGFDATVQVRLETHLYHLQLTGNEYTLIQRPDNQIRVFGPRTRDERDRWYLSIQNGYFQKQSRQRKDQEDVAAAGREAYYQTFLAGEHEYQLPEYRRQSFYPRFGERLITDERARYRDEYQISVEQTPLLIREENVDKEALTPIDEQKRSFGSSHIHWDKTTLPEIYVDEWSNGNLSLQTEGFEINYREGTVTFDRAIEGLVYATYRHDNFVIKRRRYANQKTTGELLSSRDNYTFELAGTNVALSPAPVIYKGTRQKEAVARPSEYWIDYEAGTVTFFNETRMRIYADYLTFREDELTWTDVNRQTGDVTVQERVSFKDEVYVTYVAEENHYIYKGYYDDELNTFMHLDMNPTAGHTFSLKEKVGSDWEVVEVPSEKLLNKEVFLYLLPHHSLYYKTERREDHPTRHVFGEEQWLTVKAAHPEALLLARIQVRENTTADNVVVMDARRPGGGLKDHLTQADVEERIGYTSAFWDVSSFDGMAYYKNGVSIIRIPSSVLQENGGQFNKQQIKERVDKYLAYGTYAIIEFTEDHSPSEENV